jgi:hypothetical protein
MNRKWLWLLFVVFLLTGCNDGPEFTLHHVHIVECVVGGHSFIIGHGWLTSKMRGLRFLDDGHLESIGWYSGWNPEIFQPDFWVPPCDFWLQSTWWNIRFRPHGGGYIFISAETAKD